MDINILIVEDEEQLARFIELELEHEGYRVQKAGDGRSALELATQGNFDLILLDIMLPELNGLEVLRRLQKEKPTPVILLTARDSVMDKVSGLDAGAVDYITKPFAIEELLARIRVALKHSAKVSGATGDAAGQNAGSAAQQPGNGATQPTGSEAADTASGTPATQQPGTLTWGALTLDPQRHRVAYDRQEIMLTNREFLMLKTLLENRDIVLSRDTLLERVCGYDYVGETNIVDVYVRHLRTKIDETFGIKMLHTIRGVGYVIKSE